ncbi:hypothetical protein [Streptomyces sp. NPDC004658]|uniref:hypothetical protein n=1 Tax=Streptomyces sp. NPDC004658 TaxID=3154672 RepID=UPI00339E7972
MFHEPARDSWTVGAESPCRAPVLYAVDDMTRTARARGDEVAVAPGAARARPPGTRPAHQVLMAGLGKAGLYDLGPEDEQAVRALADRLDEPTVRRVAHWLAAAGGPRQPPVGRAVRFGRGAAGQ